MNYICIEKMGTHTQETKQKLEWMECLAGGQVHRQRKKKQTYHRKKTMKKFSDSVCADEAGSISTPIKHNTNGVFVEQMAPTWTHILNPLFFYVYLLLNEDKRKIFFCFFFYFYNE